MKFLDYKSFWQRMPCPTAYYHWKKVEVSKVSTALALYSPLSVLSGTPHHLLPPLQACSWGKHMNMTAESLGITGEHTKSTAALKCSSDRPCSNTIRENLGREIPVHILNTYIRLRPAAVRPYRALLTHRGIAVSFAMEPLTQAGGSCSPTQLAAKHHRYSSTLSLGMAHYALQSISPPKHGSERYEKHCTEMTVELLCRLMKSEW